jgi:hypothetical protein
MAISQFTTASARSRTGIVEADIFSSIGHAFIINTRKKWAAAFCIFSAFRLLYTLSDFYITDPASSVILDAIGIRPALLVYTYPSITLLVVRTILICLAGWGGARAASDKEQSEKNDD